MRGVFLCLAALVMNAGQPVYAQAAADRMQSVLSRVPVAALAPAGGQGTIVAGYGNGDAVRWIAVRGAQNGDNPNTPNRFAAERSAAPYQQAAIMAHSDAALRAAVGLTPRDWVETWEVAQGPVRLGAMDIYPDSEMRLRGALFSAGFTEEQRASGPVMWRGAADYEPDAGAVNPANPFGGDMGLPVRMAFTGDRAVWATGWPSLGQALAPGGQSLASRPDAAALIAGLRRAGSPGGVVSVRLWLRNGGEVPVAGAEAGPVEGLALADFANRENEAAAMVLLLSPGTDVAALAERLRSAWPILGDVPAPAEPEITAGDSTITITIRGDWGDDGAASNAGYQACLSVLNGGRLGYMLSQ